MIYAVHAILLEMFQLIVLAIVVTLKLNRFNAQNVIKNVPHA